MWAPGARFGKYKLVERLGKGGMAETWRGELQASQGVRRPVVIKRVLPSFADNEMFIQAFIQEARITASLSHGNVAQVFDFGQLDGSHFIAMELIDGRSLDRVLKRGIAREYWHMPFPIATLIALEIAKGLEHVHTRRGPKGPLNIVHRDISPDNIIVGLNGETKVVDFGIAKSVLEGRQETEAGIIKGKSIYFSPEQARGEQVDFRTDIYSLGVVLYRLVTGKKAYEGTGLKVLNAIVRGDHVPPRQANPDLPEELALVIETAMAVDKQQRFASTLELVEALQSTLNSMAPRAGVHWIRDYVRWLYSDELKKRGEEPGLRAGFEELLANWKPRPLSTVAEEVSSESRPDEIATIASRPHQPRKPSSTRIPPVASAAPLEWTPRLKRNVAMGAGAAALALVLLVVFTTTRDPHEGESDVARKTRIEEATRLKPVGPGTAPPPIANHPPPVAIVEPDDGPDADPVEAPPPVVDDTPKGPPVAFDAEKAPVKVELGDAHSVNLDNAPVLPGSSGTLTEVKLLRRPTQSHRMKLANTRMNIDLPSAPDEGPIAAGEIPSVLYTPGKKPQLEIIQGRGRWSGPDSRLLVVVNSMAEAPSDPLSFRANGKSISPDQSTLVVDETDRFTLRDLTAKQQWKVTVTPHPSKGTVVTPVLVVARGDEVRLDGKKLQAGYGVLSAGRHTLTGAASLWLTLPTLGSIDVAAVDVTFE